MKAVIPAAGLGTRLLPATKAMPKEMLPVVDKPAIQYIVEEAVAAGLQHVLFVTGRNKNSLENHFDRAVEIESTLLGNGDLDKLRRVQKASELADIHYVRQGDPKGLGHAISKARAFVGDESFAVLLGDDIISESAKLMKEMLALAEHLSANVVALMPVEADEVSKYGIAGKVHPTPEGYVTVGGFVEKPAPLDAPSQLAVVGRYVLRPGMFDLLDQVEPGRGGEIQLTDALNMAAENPSLCGPVVGIIYSGDRFDTGDRLSYVKTIVSIASQREDIGPEFTSWLREQHFVREPLAPEL